MKKNHFYNTMMLITFMSGQCLNHYRLVVLNGQKMLKSNEDFIKHYDEDGDIGCFLKVDIEYPENLHDLHSDLAIFPS